MKTINDDAVNCPALVIGNRMIGYRKGHGVAVNIGFQGIGHHSA
ncbi:hypothetical protein PP182_12835 [Maribacter sp. PR1]|uniref:Uncharacterized protein n=1 Tax=Maribacter cobaltidurans TaxID=1178778 RepID=A0ABU7IVR2_9FLAO|nr:MULTISPECIES: hypothetical protein [Maribacter]MDC6389576.1 hypothetical protein [Maribacter sp. PR1]MEE1976965.1 hypothetical protein [Maribacter cobaltidurans]